MKNEKLELILFKSNIRYETNVDLKKKTWIHRGGKVDYFITPSNTSELITIMSFLYGNNINHLVVGCTSNLYILNSTHIPVVVSTLKCNTYKVNNDIIECECGLLVSKLACQMIEFGYKGFECLTKLPGTVGAAIYNNSSVKNEKNSISELLIDVDIITPTGVRKLSKEELHLSFRSSDLKKHILLGIIIKARLKALKGNPVVLRQIANENEKERYRILEGPSQNLGCTVNQPFINGTMPLRYRLPNAIFAKIVNLFIKDEHTQNKLKKEFILSISGYKKLIPYVSDKLIITFIWRDEKADDLFDDYLRFMNKVYKTDKVEIEIIK